MHFFPIVEKFLHISRVMSRDENNLRIWKAQKSFLRSVQIQGEFFFFFFLGGGGGGHPHAKSRFSHPEKIC